MGAAFDGITALLEGGPRTFRCPAHEDDRESLSVSEGEDGALIHCFAGCLWESILADLGLPKSAIYDDYRNWAILARSAESGRRCA